jgi:tetratricopeptide (TPR) repeat protein
LSNDHTNSNNNDSKKALVIAVSDYDNSSGLKPIEFCKNDGKEMYNILKKNGYDIPDSRKLIGYVNSQRLKKTIYDFFMYENNKPDDTLIFYYSGHGVPDTWGKTFLAPSDIDSAHPFIAGFSFDDLTNSMLACNSQRIVTILDSCFSGSLKISKSKGLDSKSGEEAATILANSIVEENSEKLKEGVGRCLLAASQGYEEAYDRKENDHSIFTYYLLEGLKGHKNAVDDEGNVTYDTLGKFITREIGNLPPEKRPKQTPVRKGEVAGGEIVLVNYPELRKEDIFKLITQGFLFVRRNNYSNAIECFKKVLSLDPQNLDIWYTQAELYLNLGKFNKCIECYDKCIELDPTNEVIKREKNLTIEKVKRKEEEEKYVKTLRQTTYSSISSVGNKKPKWKEPKITTKKKIFISYANEDAEAAKHLFYDLKEFDDPHLELFLDKESILPGQIWKDNIENAIKNSQYFVILLSKNSIEKNSYVLEELKVANDIAKELPEPKIFIIPIRLDDCQIPESLQDLHIVDLSHSWKDGFYNIVKAIGIKERERLPEHHWENLNLLTAIDQKECIPVIGELALDFYNQIDDKSFLTNKELAKEWAEKYNYPLDGPYQLPKIAQFLAIREGSEIFPKATISNMLKRMETPDFSLDKYKKSPHAILAQLDLPIYITTNYDLLLEEALKSQGKEPFSEICRWNEDLIKATENGLIPSLFKKRYRDYKPTLAKPLVFHLFGSYEYPNSMVLTERDYHNFIIYNNKEKDIFPPFFRRALATSSLLFIGYGLENDLDFRTIFQGAFSFMSTIPRNKNSFAVIPIPIYDNTYEKENNIKYLKEYYANIFQLIVYFGDINEFLTELINHWEKLEV